MVANVRSVWGGASTMHSVSLRLRRMAGLDAAVDAWLAEICRGVLLLSMDQVGGRRDRVGGEGANGRRRAFFEMERKEREGMRERGRQEERRGGRGRQKERMHAGMQACVASQKGGSRTLVSSESPFCCPFSLPLFLSVLSPPSLPSFLLSFPPSFLSPFRHTIPAPRGHHGDARVFSSVATGARTLPSFLLSRVASPCRAF